MLLDLLILILLENRLTIFIFYLDSIEISWPWSLIVLAGLERSYVMIIQNITIRLLCFLFDEVVIQGTSLVLIGHMWNFGDENWVVTLAGQLRNILGWIDDERRADVKCLMLSLGLGLWIEILSKSLVLINELLLLILVKNEPSTAEFLININNSMRFPSVFIRICIMSIELIALYVYHLL